MKTYQWKQMGLGVFLSFLITANAFAVGGANIGNEVPSARAAGQGYTAVAAQNEDPMTVYTNPAGLSQLKGTQVGAGLTWENLHGNYQTDAGAQTKMRSVDIAVPNTAVSHSFMDGKLGTGLAILSPFGLETHWAGDSPLRYVATDSRLHLVYVTPAISYQVHEKVSVGAGVDYVNVFDASLEKKLNVDVANVALGGSATGAPDANSRLKGTGANWAFHTGALYQPTEKHAFGITYHSKVRLRILGSAQLKGLSGTSAAVFGGSDYETSAYTDIFLPQNVQFGYAYKPNEKWMWETDAAWFDWYSSRDLNIRYAETNAARLAILNAGNPAALTLGNAWSVATGVNYKHNDKLQLRSGFWYEPYAMPESTYNPAFLDLSRYGLTIGAGYALTSALTMDVAYNAIFFHNRHITNTLGLTSTGSAAADISGLYQDFTNLLALGFTYKY